jgi:hypothetical protein
VPERIVDELRAELTRLTPDAWPRVLRSVTARRAARDLLATLDRPPSPQSRLGWELRQRVSRSRSARDAA